jgi:NO-binding membrane sensor protein with MHYT domain
VIAIAIGFVIFGLFSFGLSYFVFGITKLIQNASASQAAYALYIGQMLIGAGIWVILIGYLTKSRGHFTCLVKKLNQAISPNKGGLQNE